MAEPTFAEKLAARRNQSAGEQFDKSLTQLGPYTSGFSAPNEGMSVSQITKPKPMPSQNLFQKIAAVGSQTGRMALSAGKAIGSFAVNTAVDIGQAAYLTAKTPVDYITQSLQAEAMARISEDLGVTQERIQAAYAAGKMSREDYQKATNATTKAMSELTKENKKLFQGPTPVQRAQALVETAVNVLSLGSWGLGAAGSKQAFQAGLIGTKKKLVQTGISAIDKNAITALVDEAANPLEKLIMKVPAARQLVINNLSNTAKREAQKVAGESITQFLTRESKNIAVDLLIKRPVFYQSNIGEAQKVYDKILDGDYPAALTSSAWLGTQMIRGGPLGIVSGGASWLKRTTGKLAYGTGSVIDEVSKQIGNKNANQIAKYLQKLEGKDGFKEAHGTYRILQETNLRIAKEDVKEAARQIVEHYSQNNIPLESVTPKMLATDMANWAKADGLAQRMIRSGLIKGVSAADASKYVVVRWDNPTKKALALALGSTTNKAEQMAILEQLASRPGSGWGNNNILMGRLRNIVNNSNDVAKDIEGITTASTQLKGVPKKISEELSKLGYTVARPAKGRITPIVDIDETRKIITGAVDGNTNLFDVATAPQPQLAAIASFFEKAGISPVESNSTATRKLSQEVVAALDEVDMSAQLGLRGGKNKDVVNGGRAMLSKLQDYVETKPGVLGMGKSAVTDIRQLTIGEIGHALNISKKEASAVSRAIMDGYAKVPMEFRGLGDEIVDRLYQYNPLHKYYSRIQSALRYTYNPFFRTQERVETKLLSHAQGNNLIWNRKRVELDDAAQMLDEAGIFTSSLPGEAAQDLVLGRITANITAGQKRDLAGLALDLADQRGLTLQEMAGQHADEIDDLLRVVVQYPKKGILASPLARTMNLMFFPMRYNAKVTILAANVLAKQPPSVQLAVIHAGFKMKDWLKSDEGIQWQSQHADAIQVLSWITPVNSIQYSMNLLNGGPDNVAELGQLGGLPLGFISQILDSQGVIKLNRPYVNPKNGEMFPDYIPQTAKARASTALVDLLGSMFTFPGRTLGLPGKQASIRAVVKDFIATNGDDFEKRMDTDNLTDLQKNWIRVLAGDTSKEAVDSLYNAPAPNQFQYYTLPPLGFPDIKPKVDYVGPKTKTKKFARPIQ